MILDEKPTIPIILDPGSPSARSRERGSRANGAKVKKQEAEGNHFVLLRSVCPPYNLIGLETH